MKRARTEAFLTPLKPIDEETKLRKIVTFDIESKDGDTQNRGFTRPFLVDFFDGDEHYVFQNDIGMEHIPWETRHIQRGGCIDKFMRWLLRLDGCSACNYSYTLDMATRPGRPCRSCRDHRRKYAGGTTDIYSHNGGRFDELFILGWGLLNRKYVRFEMTAVSNRIQKLEFRPAAHEDQEDGRGTGLRWCFLDSAALIPLSLQKIGEDILGGVEELPAVKDSKEMAKAKLHHDLDIHEFDESWLTYVKADNEVLYLALHKFIDLLRSLGGDVGITAPSASMKLFRMKFQQGKIARNRHFKWCNRTCEKSIDHRPCSPYCDLHCHGCAHDWVRRGYYGGRTEVFRRFGRRMYYYDINSSYPASMKEDMPVGEMIVLDPTTTWDALRLMRQSSVGFIECEVEIPEGVEVPPLPVRYNGKLVFPTGKFRGVWDFDELELLFDPLVNGKVTKVYRSVWYQSAPVFKEMIDVLYHYRTKHVGGCKTKHGLGTICGAKHCNPDYTEGLAYVCKLMLNSLYGKFGMREERVGVVMVGEDEQKPADGWPLGGKHDSPFWEVKHLADAAYVIPQISAHITALSRIRLWKGMADVVRRGGVLYYCDTDSIMSSLEMEESDLLGGWKREEEDKVLDGEFVLPKLYQLKFHYPACIDPECQGCFRGKKLHRHDCKDKTCKGCTSSVEKMKGVQYAQQTPENWELMVNQGKEVEINRLTQHKTMLNAGMLSPKMVNTSKSLRSNYDKRVMDKNGVSKALHIVKLDEDAW